nr:hypothetical protein BaRGS_016428 [Batillaria attramentaria]
MRPRSVPLHGHRTAALTPRPPSAPRPDTPLVNQGNFDTLSPRILSQLLDDVSPRPPSASYGDRVLTRGDKRSRTKDPFKQIFPDDLSTTSGFDSDDDDEDEEDDDDDDDEASDSENGGFEPSLDEVRRKVPYPQNVLHLRPEKLDAIYVPEDKRDMRRFDFDAENVDLPPYEFKCPLPDKLMNVNLRLCAREGTDWRDSLKTLPLNSVSANVSGMMDRLVELEKMQIVTEDWETKRLRQLGRPRPQNAAGSGSTISGGSRATSARIRDRRCCGNCLQAACVGDCPDKRLNATASGRCEKCRQPLCTGACQDSRYEQRMRHSRSSDALELEVGPPPPQPARSPSRGCVSCQRRHTAKLINANNVVLGRPKSSNATFSRGKASLRPRDLRPASAVNMNTSMLKDFERLGIEPQQPSPPTKSPYQRPRSRNGLLPGKSCRSNRKYSLTDVTYTGRKKKSVRTKASSGRQSAQAVS